MATYYEILGLPVTASVSEVEITVEAQYNKWRRLVTHHDPTVADEANRALRTLEQIRATLTDPAKRAVYDQSLNVGGLADPEALLMAAQPAPPKAPPRLAGKSEKRTDAWICGKCQLANAVGLQFCSDCGDEIGRACPKCQKMIAIAATFCAYCGGEIETVLQKQAEARARIAQEEAARRVKKLQEQIQVEEAAIQKLEQLKAKKWISPIGEGPKILRDSVGCLPKLGVMVITIAIYLLGVYIWALSFLEPAEEMLVESFVTSFVTMLILTILYAIIMTGWLSAMLIKPAIDRRIQSHLDRIAELERSVKGIERTSLSNLKEVI